LYIIAKNMSSTYNVTYCFDKSCCCRRYKHLPFQCEYNDSVTISSYVREIMTFMMWNKLKNLLLGRVHSNFLIFLKILMMHLINMWFMIYLNFALIITRKKMAIFLNILIDALHQ
jgi:hypothetical protein